jgi:hypothetical protein
MNTPLRDELGKIIKPWTAEMTPDITDEILVLIDSKMPEKKEPSDPKYHNKPHAPEPRPPHKCDDEDCEHYIDMPPKSVQIMKNYNDGWNAFRAEVKSILKGGTDE